MREFVKNLKCEYSEKITALLKKKVSFAISGITNCAKLVILAQMLFKNGEKLVFITETEQKALKFQNDLKKLFQEDAVIFPYQDGSVYDTNSKNLYKYARQIQILFGQKTGNILIVPQKALFEKFPDKNFMQKNSLVLKHNDDIDVEDFAKRLISLGYKRKTLVADVGEFSVRGDIIDVFPLSERPFRVELWGDTITDIRIFDNSNQRSIEKVKEVVIQPVYKFVSQKASYKKLENLVDKEDENQLNFLEQLKNESYSEGIDYYTPYFNDDLKMLTEILSDDFVFVFDDYTQFKARFEQSDENLTKQYEENVKTGMTLPLPAKAHPDLSEFLTSLSSFEKVYFDNFISEDFDITIELTTELIPYFAAGLKDIAVFILKKLKEHYKIVAATDYKNRTEEIFKEYEIPFSYDINEPNSVYITDNAVLAGSLIEDCKLIIITDKELFNKRSKDITGVRYNYKRENLDFIESLNDIKEGDVIEAYVMEQIMP